MSARTDDMGPLPTSVVKTIEQKIADEYVALLKREMAYPHWSPEQKNVFELSLKWYGEIRAKWGLR